MQIPMLHVSEVRQSASHPQCWGLQYAFSNTLKVWFFHMNIRSFYILGISWKSSTKIIIKTWLHAMLILHLFHSQDQACRMVIFPFDEVLSDHPGRRARCHLLALRDCVCLPLTIMIHRNLEQCKSGQQWPQFGKCVLVHSILIL